MITIYNQILDKSINSKSTLRGFRFGCHAKNVWLCSVFVYLRVSWHCLVGGSGARRRPTQRAVVAAWSTTRWYEVKKRILQQPDNKQIEFTTYNMCHWLLHYNPGKRQSEDSIFIINQSFKPSFFLTYISISSWSFFLLVRYSMIDVGSIFVSYWKNSRETESFVGNN